MIMVYIICGVIAIAALWFVIKWFNEHCEDKFDHKFFTMPVLIALGIAGALCIFGLSWYTSSAKTNNSGYTLLNVILNGDTLNGIIMIALGLITYIVIAVYNFIRTNWIYGVIGTLIQFALLSFFAYVGFILLIIYFVITAAASMGDTRVHVVNK